MNGNQFSSCMHHEVDSFYPIPGVCEKQSLLPLPYHTVDHQKGWLSEHTDSDFLKLLKNEDIFFQLIAEGASEIQSTRNSPPSDAHTEDGEDKSRNADDLQKPNTNSAKESAGSRSSVLWPHRTEYCQWSNVLQHSSPVNLHIGAQVRKHFSFYLVSPCQNGPAESAWYSA